MQTNHILLEFPNNIQSIMVIPGGHTEIKAVADSQSCSPAELQEKVRSLQSQAEETLGETFPRFEAIQFRQQVVAGTIYHFKILVSDSASDNDNDADVVHIKAFEPLPFENKPMEIKSIQKAKKGDDLALMK